MSKTIVFGGGGFVGKAVLRLLIDKSHHFLAPPSSTVNLLKENNLSSFFRENVSDDDSLIIIASKMPYTGNEHDSFQNMFHNVEMVRNIISCIENQNVKEVVYVSTIDVYGKNEKTIDEESILNPRTNYASSKAAAEFLLRAFAKKKEIPLAILRVSHIYGIEDPSPKMINKMMRDSYLKNIIKVTGGKDLLRDFIHVDDLAYIIQQCINKRINDTFNVATGQSISIKELANMICSLNSSCTVEVSNNNASNGCSYLFNISKLENNFDLSVRDFRRELTSVYHNRYVK